jgi:hypothetical protein
MVTTAAGMVEVTDAGRIAETAVTMMAADTVVIRVTEVTRISVAETVITND